MIDAKNFIEASEPIFKLLSPYTNANGEYTPFKIEFLLKEGSDGTISVANPTIKYGDYK